MKRIACALLALSWVGCGTPLATGERLYREGDRLAALETWRAIPEDDAGHEKAQERIAVVEEEFHQLVVRYKQRARYFEAKERLAESIVNYRLADSLPDSLELTAQTARGEIMGVRHRELPLEGVQFHPESVLTPEGDKLMNNLMRMT